MPEPNYVVIVGPVEVLCAIQTSLNNHGLGIGFLCVVTEYLRAKIQKGLRACTTVMPFAMHVR